MSNYVTKIQPTSPFCFKISYDKVIWMDSRRSRLSIFANGGHFVAKLIGMKEVELANDEKLIWGASQAGALQYYIDNAMKEPGATGRKLQLRRRNGRKLAGPFQWSSS